MAEEVEEFRFDPDDLTIGEMEMLEETLEQPFGTIMGQLQGSALSVKHIKAVAWILKRRQDPSITLEDISRMKVLKTFASAEPAPKD